MRRVFFAILGLLAGYAAGAALGGALVSLYSDNMHDKNLEIAMTSAFVTGPIGGLIGLLTGWFVPRAAKER